MKNFQAIRDKILKDIFHESFIPHKQKDKRYLKSSIVNSVYELPHEFSNNLRLKILGN